MKEIIPESTPQAAWYRIVEEAKRLTGYQFSDALQSYLILTLEHYTTQSHIASRVIALDFLEHAKLDSTMSILTMREIGDHCLLLSGLFPERIKRKNVSLSYIIGMGKQAYQRLSASPRPKYFDPKLFFNLQRNFVGLMDVLHHMRTNESYA